VDTQLDLMNDEIQIDEVKIKTKAKSLYSFSNNRDVKGLESSFSGEYSELFVFYLAHKMIM
jgi:hypothetical protein